MDSPHPRGAAHNKLHDALFWPVWALRICGVQDKQANIHINKMKTAKYKEKTLAMVTLGERYRWCSLCCLQFCHYIVFQNKKNGGEKKNGSLVISVFSR